MSSLIRAYIVANILFSGHNTLTQTGDLFLKYNCLGKFGGKQTLGHMLNGLP